jgi:recombinational DNA repair protein (RecF pathway)
VRRLVIAFAIGAAAFALLVAVAGLVAGVAADAAGWSSFRVALGPFVVVDFERVGRGSETTLGAGVAVVALAGGIANAAAAALLLRDRR